MATSYLTNSALAFNSAGIGAAGTHLVSMVASAGTVTFFSTDGTTRPVALSNITQIIASDFGTISFASSAGAGTCILTNLTTPSNPTDAVNKTYVDSLVGTGVSWKTPVEAATTVNIPVFPPTDGVTTVGTIDGVSVTIGDRILVKNQTNATGNGIWNVTAGTWTRPTDSSITTPASGAATYILGGTTLGGQSWICNTTTGAPQYLTVNFGTAIAFVQFASNPSVAGSNTQIQFNNNGNFGSSSNFTYDGTELKVANATQSTAVGTGAVISSGGLGVALNAFIGGQVNVTQVTTSTGQTTGSLVLAGGAGIAKDIYVGVQGTVFVQNTTDSSSSVTGSMIVSGGVGFAKSVYIGSVAHVASTLFADSATDSTSCTDGSLVVAGGLGLNKSLYVGTSGTVYVQNTVNATNATTGALIVSGGFSVFRDSYFNGLSHHAGTVYADSVTASVNATTGSLIVAGGIGSVGRLYIGDGTNSTTTATGAVVVNGGVGISGDCTANQFNTTSDIQYKTNISRLNDPLKTLNKIEGYTYNWKKSYASNNDKLQSGVIAQQLEEIGLGHLVSGTDSKTVNYLGLIPILIEAVKEINTTVEKHERQLAAPSESVKLRIRKQ